MVPAEALLAAVPPPGVRVTKRNVVLIVALVAFLAAQLLFPFLQSAISVLLMLTTPSTSSIPH